MDLSGSPGRLRQGTASQGSVPVTQPPQPTCRELFPGGQQLTTSNRGPAKHKAGEADEDSHWGGFLLLQEQGERDAGAVVTDNLFQNRKVPKCLPLLHGLSHLSYFAGVGIDALPEGPL